MPFPEAQKAREVLIAIVKYRQNSTLQGSIRGRLTKSMDVNFRSALELMRMMQMMEIAYKSECLTGTAGRHRPE